MTSRQPKTTITGELIAYALQHSSPRDQVLLRVEAQTAARSDAKMMMAPEQGLFTTMLVRLTGARQALEVGTFTGYGAISIARGLPADGRLLCLELSAELAAIARENVDAAGVGDKVRIQVGPALDSLRALPVEASFDLSFIDADKTGYPAYVEEVLTRTRSGGILLLDNTLRSGQVLDPGDDEATRTIDELNANLAGDERVDVVLLPVADGLTIVRKR